MANKFCFIIIKYGISGTSFLPFEGHFQCCYGLSYFIFIHRTLLKLGSLLWSSNIPLLVCRSYGFIGCMRIVLQEHCGKSQLDTIIIIHLISKHHKLCTPS